MSLFTKLSQQLRRAFTIGSGFIQTGQQVRRLQDGAFVVTARESDLKLHQLRRQVVGVILFKLGSEGPSLVLEAEVEVRLGQEIQGRARIWFLFQNFFQILDRAL